MCEIRQVLKEIGGKRSIGEHYKAFCESFRGAKGKARAAWMRSQARIDAIAEQGYSTSELKRRRLA